MNKRTADLAEKLRDHAKRFRAKGSPIVAFTLDGIASDIESDQWNADCEELRSHQQYGGEK